jgi:hypothetical protein
MMTEQTIESRLRAEVAAWAAAGGREDVAEDVARLLGACFEAVWTIDIGTWHTTARPAEALGGSRRYTLYSQRPWLAAWFWYPQHDPDESADNRFLGCATLLDALVFFAAAGVPVRETVSTPWASAPAPGEGEGTDEPCDIIPWLRQQSKGGCHDAADEIAALRARAETAEAKERVALILSPSRICEEYHYQACHVCERVGCGDNTSPAVVELRALRARVAELEGERHRWRAEAERLRDRACWTPVLREQTKAAADTLIIEAGEAARAGRGEMATSIREARDVLVHGLGRLETERDELSARCARLAAVVRAEERLEQVVARSEPPEWRPLRSFDDGPIEGWICSGCGAERDYDDETGDPPDPCPCGIAAERALAVAVVARAALQPGDVEPAPAGGDGGEG